MYINTKLLQEKQIHLSTVLSLQLLKQNRQEDLSSVMESYFGSEGLKQLEEAGYVEYVKQKKKSDTLFHLARLSKKGAELLEQIETPDISQGDVELMSYLTNMYFQEGEDRKIGNKKATTMYIAQFRQIVGLSLHQMYYLLEMFCQEVVYSKMLEYVFFSKKENPYAKFKDNIETSKIYQYYDENKDRIINYWKQKGCYE